MSLGKAIRLQRIFGDPSGHLLSVAVDHWIGYPKTMTDGLHDLPKTLVQIAAAKPDAVTMMEGTATKCWPPYAGQMALIIQLGCFTPDDRVAETIGSVQDVARLGADAVAFSIGVRGSREGFYLRMLSGAVTEAERFGLPLIAHIYPRAYNDGVTEIVADPENIAWAVRCGIECGADVIKVTYPGDPGAFRDIIACSPVPVIAAGGPTTDTFREALLQAEAIMTSGASGLTVGRNVWAPGRNTVGAISAYKAVVHEKLGVDDAMKAAEEVGLS